MTISILLYIILFLNCAYVACLQRKSVFSIRPRKAQPKRKTASKGDDAGDENKDKSIFNSKAGEGLTKHKKNAEEILQWSNATPIRCHAGRGYACCFCKDQFPDPADLKQHTIETHDAVNEIATVLGKDSNGLCIKLDITALQCKLCKQDIDTLETLIEHLVKVHDRKLFTELKNQILPFKFDTEMLRCFICGNVFNKFKALLQHMSCHYRNFDCDQCDTGFVNRQKLHIHKKGHKTGEFTCDFCPKVFFTVLKKKTHESRIHTNAKMMHKCHYCNEKFRDSRQKDAHLERVHAVTSFARKCQACNKVFVHQNALMIHMKRHHLIERHHKCTQCEKAFFSSTELREHMVKHTGKRDFRCEICFKSYGRKWTLREHMRIHADDRRFKCEHCNMAFVQKCSLRGHLRSKHGEMEYAADKRKKLALVPRKVKRREIIIQRQDDETKDVRVLARSKLESFKHQENIKEILLNSNATPIRRRLSTGYLCCFCPEVYTKPAELKHHTMTAHDDRTKANYLKDTPLQHFLVKLDITDLQCTLCNVRLNELNDLIHHLQDRHDKLVHNDLKSHIIPFRFGNGLLRCVHCSKETNNFKIMLEHMNAHYKNYVCDVCGSGYVNKRTLIAHSYRHKTGVFTCNFCAKIFDTRVKMKEHERAVHINFNMRSKCGYCGQKFKDYAVKNDHEAKEHGAERILLACNACDKSFDNQRKLNLHLKTYHLLQRVNKKVN